MQWDNTPNAGFTSGVPWLPIPVSYKTHNVASELENPNSILMFYKNLLALRHSDPALLDGDYVALNQDDANVMSYLRRYQDEAVLVVLNMSPEPQKASFNLAPQGFSSSEAKTLLTTMPEMQGSARWQICRWRHSRSISGKSRSQQERTRISSVLLCQTAVAKRRKEDPSFAERLEKQIPRRPEVSA